MQNTGRDESDPRAMLYSKDFGGMESFDPSLSTFLFTSFLSS